MREITFVESIRETTEQILNENPNVIVIGEGVPDPKSIFGSTKGLQEKFGKDRVFDMPVSENGMTGICIGAAIQGIRPILIHQRIDFMLYAMDQMINNAAKWNSMFGGQAGNVPMVVRAIIGRGWGPGNQHSQNLAHLFSMFPGLKVVCPSNAREAKEMLLWSVKEKGPVVFVEHRHLHGTTAHVEESMTAPEEIKAMVVREGRNLTLVAWSHMVNEALKAADKVEKFTGISVEVVDMRSLRPLDINTVKKSLKKTGRLLLLEEAWAQQSLSAEIISQIVEDKQVHLYERPARMTLPNCYAPSTHHLTKYYYPKTSDIAAKIVDMTFLFKTKLNCKLLIEGLIADEAKVRHDVPDPSFKGPF